MRYQPLFNRVFVDPIQDSKVTKGGIVLPDIATRNKNVAFGTVAAVGPGRNTAEGGTIACVVKVGDVIAFPRMAPAVLPLIDEEGNETLQLMMPESEIIAIVHELPRPTGLVDITGASILGIQPQSLALPDSVYANREGIDRGVSDLRQQNAPPDVIAELQQNRDEGEGDLDAVEH